MLRTVLGSMTGGHKSSERKACYHAGIFAVSLAIYGIYKGSDLSGLALVIGAVCSPFMAYAGARSFVKSKRGEDDILDT